MADPVVENRDVRSLPDFHVMRYENSIPTTSTSSSSSSQCSRRNTIDDISLKLSSSWTYCGPFLDLQQPSSLTDSVTTWAAATLTTTTEGHQGPSALLLSALNSFLAFVHEFLSHNGIFHYWLTVRASQATNDYDVPRWHTDDFFFGEGLPSQMGRQPSPGGRCNGANGKMSSTLDWIWSWRRSSSSSPLSSSLSQSPSHSPSVTKTDKSQSNDNINNTLNKPNPLQGTNWKLATTLLGPGTLFISHATSLQARTIQRAVKDEIRSMPQNQEHACTSIRCLGCATAAEDVRMRLAHALKDHPIVQTQPGECVFFRVGEDGGAMHSEPRCQGDRIFVNVVPGTEEELRTLLQKWGMGFPRAWCIGLPFLETEMGLSHPLGVE